MEKELTDSTDESGRSFFLAFSEEEPVEDELAVAPGVGVETRGPPVDVLVGFAGLVSFSTKWTRANDDSKTHLT